MAIINFPQVVLNTYKHTILGYGSPWRQGKYLYISIQYRNMPNHTWICKHNNKCSSAICYKQHILTVHVQWLFLWTLKPILKILSNWTTNTSPNRNLQTDFTFRIPYADQIPLLAVGMFFHGVSHSIRQQRAIFFFLPNADQSSFGMDQRNRPRMVLVQVLVQLNGIFTAITGVIWDLFKCNFSLKGQNLVKGTSSYQKTPAYKW